MLEVPSPAAAPEASSGEMLRTTRFSYMPLDGEIPLVLTSHFGRFHVEIVDGDQSRRIRSRIAFSYWEAGSGESETLFSERDFWACRTTYAIDILTGRPHRLIWGLDARGALVTFIRPVFDLSDPSRWGVPRLIPIDQRSFNQISEMIAQNKLMKQKRRRTAAHLAA